MENTNQLITVVQENNLSEDFAVSLQNAFSPLFESARSIANEGKEIVVTSEDQRELMTLARNKRLELRDVRIETENLRKRLKEQSLRTGKAIDGMANIIKFLIVPVEEHLELQEKFIELKIEKELSLLAEKRTQELEQYEVITTDYDLRNMSEEGYKQLLNNSRIAFEAKQAKAKEEEEAKEEEDKRQAEEQERIRKENEKLRKENEKKQKEQEKLQEKLKKEADAKRKIEEELRKKEEAEKLKKEADAKRAQEEEQARIKAERDALLAPDKEKMRIVYKKIVDLKAEIETLSLSTEDARDVRLKTISELNTVARNLGERMKAL